MNRRPVVVAFDVIETLFSLEPLRPRLSTVGLPESSLEVWFARLLRDAFALTVAGVYKPFRVLAEASLMVMAADKGIALEKTQAEQVIDGFSALPAHPDVEPAFDLLKSEGIRIITLTNGSSATTAKLLKGAGLEEFVQSNISIDSVKKWKPAREVYLSAARTTGVEPAEMALVAAHSWDIQGARSAGLVTGWVAREEKQFLNAMDGPDVKGNGLIEVVQALLGLPGR